MLSSVRDSTYITIDNYIDTFHETFHIRRFDFTSLKTFKLCLKYFFVLCTKDNDTADYKNTIFIFLSAIDIE